MMENKIKKPYILYVGNAYPHKNLERLLWAFKIVTEQRNDLFLILVGKIDYFYQRLQLLSKKLTLENRIIFVGQVNNQELIWLYKNGIAYIFPSLREGFGLPGLEAMEYGLPIISSNNQPLPEIYGKAAYYFSPISVNEIAKAVLKVINNSLIRKDLIKKGYQQIKKYSWEKNSQETLKIYNSIK